MAQGTSCVSFFKSVIGCRMDQNATVDPANVVRAEDKPDFEAELPSRGTSQSLKNKFQAMDGGQPPNVDFSQPIKREKPTTSQNRYVASLLHVSNLLVYSVVFCSGACIN